MNLEVIWFIIIAGMLTIYIILDGFDLGAAIVYPFVTRSESDRQTIFRSIGPVWDGNEVWLIAGGGSLYFVLFP